ncbi:dihydrofolate reductase family protein [Aeromicrobium panaciterrae]|uniref:dihydrofolate reductase family protein n=1 Tax=Aeromicrobium panaciterrae TaxID=363861 RepID=UPI0031D7C511
MPAVVLAMTTSLDGFATGPDISVEDAMGVGGEALHEWIFGDDPVDQKVARSLSAGIGACIIGRTMHDLGVPHWEDVPYPLPTVVLTHEELPDRQMKSDSFRYVAGVEQALARAKELAGDKDVLVMGGSATAQQFLNAGLIDEIRLSIAHLLLGDGVRLFDDLDVAPGLETVSSESSTHATHLVLRTTA